VFHVISKYFFFNFQWCGNILTSLLDSTHTKYPAAMRWIFNYILYGYSFILYALIIKVIIWAYQKVHVVSFDNQGIIILLRSTVYNEFLCHYIWGSWNPFSFHLFCRNEWFQISSFISKFVCVCYFSCYNGKWFGK
jgi:hypothetical protein